MTPRAARVLIRLYPRAWRERYGAEFAALLEDSPGGIRTAANVLLSAVVERVFSTHGGTMHPQLKAWVDRAPWAIFAVAPLGLLTGAYFVCYFILSSGWRIFLPGASTPFVPVHGFATVYFGFGRLLYFSAPVLIGWGIALMAGRQQIKVVWPAIGVVLMALIGAMVQVHASRADNRAVGDVSIDIGVGASLNTFSYQLLHATIILTFAALPYLILRYQRGRSISA